MKLAVISDTHDHLENLEKALTEINELGAGVLLHCGDLVSPFVIDRLAKFNGPVHVVFGNNEGDRYTINNVATKKFPNVKLHGEMGFVETESGEAAFTHRPEFARGLACTQKYRRFLWAYTSNENGAGRENMAHKSGRAHGAPRTAGMDRLRCRRGRNEALHAEMSRTCGF